MPPTTHKILEVPLAKIHIGEQQLREVAEDDALAELAEDIAARGLLQPIGLKPLPNGEFQLLFGSRRLLAHRRLGRATILARLLDSAEDEVKAVALAENIHRSQLTLEEEVEAVCYLHGDGKHSIEHIASILHKSRSWVLNRLMVPNLPEWLRDPMMDGALGIGHVEVIAKVPGEEAQRYLIAQCLNQRWNVSQLKTIAFCYMNPAAPNETVKTNTPGVQPFQHPQAFLYTCEICNQKGLIHEFTLVRVHHDGYGCRSLTDRSNHESAREHGLDRKDEHD